MALKDLYNGYYKAVHDARAILDRADRERRDLTADESAQYDRIDAEIERLGREIERDSKPRPALPARPAAPTENGKALEVVYPGVRLGHAAGRPERRTVVRPGSPEALRHSEVYRKAYLNYLQTGRQQLGLQVSKDHDGRREGDLRQRGQGQRHEMHVAALDRIAVLQIADVVDAQDADLEQLRVVGGPRSRVAPE